MPLCPDKSMVYDDYFTIQLPTICLQFAQLIHIIINDKQYENTNIATPRSVFNDYNQAKSYNLYDTRKQHMVLII